MRIHAYRVVPLSAVTMDETLEAIAALPLERRMSQFFGEKMRLETELRTNTGAWFLDFAAMRQQGPGRCAPDTPIEDFELDDDEGFGEETAAYFHPQSGFLALQYNHRGAKIRGIQNYLFGFAKAVALQHGLPDGMHGFNFAAVLREGAMDRFDRRNNIRGIEVLVSVPTVQQADHGVRSLGNVIATGAATGANTLRLEMNVGRERQARLNPNAVRDMVLDLLPMVGDGVRKMAVHTGGDDEGPSEVIDFVSERLEAKATVPNGHNSRRPDRNARWRALEETFHEWHNAQLLR